MVEPLHAAGGAWRHHHLPGGMEQRCAAAVAAYVSGVGAPGAPCRDRPGARGALSRIVLTCGGTWAPAPARDTLRQAAHGRQLAFAPAASSSGARAPNSATTRAASAAGAARACGARTGNGSSTGNGAGPCAGPWPSLFSAWDFNALVFSACGGNAFSANRLRVQRSHLRAGARDPGVGVASSAGPASARGGSTGNGTSTGNSASP